MKTLDMRRYNEGHPLMFDAPMEIVRARMSPSLIKQIIATARTENITISQWLRKVCIEALTE